LLTAEAGSRPGGRGTFLCFAKEKYPKERRPPVCGPFAVRRGKPASGRLRGAPWNSLRCDAASFRHPRRVRARSMGAQTPMPPRNRPAAGAASRGGRPNIQTTEQPDFHSGHCCARPRLRSARRLRPRSGAERSDGPCGCSVPRAPLDAPRSAGFGGSGLACV
jgi:hypothetical protein